MSYLVNSAPSFCATLMHNLFSTLIACSFFFFSPVSLCYHHRDFVQFLSNYCFWIYDFDDYLLWNSICISRFVFILFILYFLSHYCTFSNHIFLHLFIHPSSCMYAHPVLLTHSLTLKFVLYSLYLYHDMIWYFWTFFHIKSPFRHFPRPSLIVSNPTRLEWYCLASLTAFFGSWLWLTTCFYLIAALCRISHANSTAKGKS